MTPDPGIEPRPHWWEASALITTPGEGGGGGYSTDVWVGRCGWGAQTLNLFKTEISDFPTLFKIEISNFPTLLKTASRFLKPRLNTFNQNSLPSFVVAEASDISANQKGKDSVFCTIFVNLKCTLFEV